MKEELKEAFRIYDKDSQGFITTATLKEILREIDTTLTEDDLDNIIDEVDEDGSGTLDFDEFQEMMMGQMYWEFSSNMQNLSISSILSEGWRESKKALDTFVLVDLSASK